MGRLAVALVVMAIGVFALRSLTSSPAPAPQQATQPTVAERPQPRSTPETPRNDHSVLVRAPEDVPVGPDGVRHFGYTPDPKATAAYVRSLPKPFLAQAGPEILRSSDNTPVLLYRALYEAYAAHNGGRRWQVGSQKIGDCVSWGYAHLLDTHLAVMWKLRESSEWRPAATEALYGGGRVEARGISYAGFSDGSYGGAQTKFITGWGYVFRQPYPELNLDLSTYDGSRAKQWGAYGCGGRDDNGRLDALCKLHPVKDAVLVTTFQEAAAAIQSGYPVAVCSRQGFSSRRDGQGFADAQGAWAHCMCFIGVRFDRPGLLCMNSWGPNWISGPKWPSDQPDGSFWVDARTAESMLRGRDSFALSGFKGFPYKNLKNGDWVQVEPRAVRRVERDIAARAQQHATGNQYSLAP